MLQIYGHVLQIYGYEPTDLWSCATDLWCYPQACGLTATDLWSCLRARSWKIVLLQIYGGQLDSVLLLRVLLASLHEFRALVRNG